MPRVSVITPCNNAEAFLGEAVRNILKQTYDDLEMIVVDDGSEDTSVEILHGFDDPRIRLIRQENRGPAAADPGLPRRGRRLAPASGRSARGGFRS